MQGGPYSIRLRTMPNKLLLEREPQQARKYFILNEMSFHFAPRLANVSRSNDKAKMFCVLFGRC